MSSTLIQIPNWGNVLLDCGEGTWGQLSRRFGKDPPDPDGNVYGVLRDIKCIFISHIHGDHHIGLAKVLAQRRRVRFNTLNPYSRHTDAMTRIDESNHTRVPDHL